MDFPAIAKKIVGAVKSIRAERLVIDSISILNMMFEDKFMIRSELISLLDELKGNGVTTLLTAEIPGDYGSRAEFIEFVGDAVIKLDAQFIGKEFQRTITIKKMRRSKHSTHIHPFRITKNGIEVLKV
jgi:KaiC/GvpD/RAD55 family RecA-like ATPase